jgi:ATP adenylyltransferase
MAGVTVEDSSHLVGVPDEFQRLWTPHRMVYIQQGQQRPHGDDCPFCVAPSLSDEEALIVHRGKKAFALLNLFPYNSGHLLVCPYRHVALYDDATVDEVAGAGIASHLHQHIVPRWGSDANFLPIIAKTKALPQLLGDARAAIAGAWPTPAT